MIRSPLPAAWRLAPLLLALAGPGLTGCTREITCPEGAQVCAGQCVDARIDGANCGGCGLSCAALHVCQAGVCACAPGLSACGDACVDLAADPSNCGSCGTACGPGTVCSTVGGVTVCALDCATGLTDCNGACVDLAADRQNCGACGRRCTDGEACLGGAPTSVQVACFATNDVRAISPDLLTRAPPRAAGQGPVALAVQGADLWSAASLSGSLSRLPLDLAASPTEYLLSGKDFEYLTALAGRILVSSSGAGTIVIVDPATGGVLDEVPVPAGAVPAPSHNLRGIALASGGGVDKLYVSLYGDSATGNPAIGQVVKVLDATRLASCGLSGSPLPCLIELATIDLAGGADTGAGGLPFPGRSVTFDGKVYVVLANLKLGTSGYFTDPAGPGRLAVIDPVTDTATYLSLGAGCGNPGGLAVHARSIWVACGAGGLVEVDLSGATPVVGPVLDARVMAPGNVAFCGDHGFVTDQWSGDLYPFDPVTFANSPAGTTTVCPNGTSGWAWAADVLCASRP